MTARFEYFLTDYSGTTRYESLAETEAAARAEAMTFFSEVLRDSASTWSPGEVRLVVRDRPGRTICTLVATLAGE